MAHNVPVTSALSLGGLLCAAVALAGQYHGTVVDADTGQPVPEAAVVVVWYKKAIIALPTGDAPEHFHAVKDTMTDASGRFSVSAGPGVDWNPFTHVEEPEIVVYKPGYEPLAPPFAVRRGFKTFKDLDSALRHGTMIRLPKLNPPGCQPQPGLAMNLSDLGGFIDVPEAHLLQLKRLINRQRERCGVHSFYPEGEKP